MARCRSCDAEIIWTVTERGKKMPVDAEPATDGDWRIESREFSLPPVAVRDPGDRDDGRLRFHSHFFTCPSAAEHRKPRRAAE